MARSNVVIAVAALLLVICFLDVSYAKKKSALPRDLYCSACETTVDAIEEELNKTAGTTETIQVGHRLDKNGQYKKKKYAETELRYEEVLETVCDGLNNYGVEGTEPNRKYASLNRKGGTFNNFSFSSEHAKDLKATCEKLVEQYEEDIITTLKEGKNLKNTLCGKIAGACKKKKSKKAKETPAEEAAEAADAVDEVKEEL